MYLIQVALFVLYYSNYCYCASTRVWLHKNKCGKYGFSCAPGNKTLIYECPVRTKEYHIYVNEFNGPNHIESLIIRNCKTLTVLLRCTKYKNEKKALKYLQVSNIERLKIQSIKNYQSQLPPKVVFEDIKLIEKIPSYSFSQVNKRLNRARCILPAQDFNSVYFRNVTINAVNTRAFYMLNRFGNVTFTDVILNNMEASSVIVNHDEDGVFLMDKSAVQALKPFSFQIVGKNAIFSESKFESIPSSGINATIETFNFINNSVKTLHSHALSVLASNVFILNNRFDSLKAEAFQQIGPRAFGELKFTYHFSRNDINFMDAGCLHPNLMEYENVSSKISFSSNRLSCACDKLGWLFSTLDQGKVTASMEVFYKTILDEKNKNICSSSCNLPLIAAREMIKNGNCMQNITVERLCETKDRVTTIITSTHQSDTNKFTTHSFRTPTIPPGKHNFSVIPVSEKRINSSTQTPEMNLTNKAVSSTFRIPTLKTSHSKSTTATVKWSTLRTTKYEPLNKIVEEITNTVIPKQTDTSGVTSSLFSNKEFEINTTDIVKLSTLGTTKDRTLKKSAEETTYATVKSKQANAILWVNNLTIPSYESSSLSHKEPDIKSTAVKAPTLSPVMSKLQIPESLEFVNSAENCIVSFLILVCSILCVVINTSLNLFVCV